MAGSDIGTKFEVSATSDVDLFCPAKMACLEGSELMVRLMIVVASVRATSCQEALHNVLLQAG